MTRVLVATLATTGLLALVGCGGNPQVAAYVGGTTSAINVRVQQGEVDQIAEVIAGTTSDATDAAVTFRAPVMQILIQIAFAEQVAKDAKIAVTDAQRQEIYGQVELYPELLKNPVTHDFIVALADASVVLTDEASKAPMAELLASTPIKVNPRFGTWDAKAGGLVAGSPGSLSEPAATTQG